MSETEDKATALAKHKLISHFYKQHPELSEANVTALLSDVKRLVKVVVKIRTQPQGKFVYKDGKNGDVIFKTNLEELEKVPDEGKGLLGRFRSLFREFKK